MAEMPRLSESMFTALCNMPVRPGVCMACYSGDGRAVSRWQEHDESDRPEPILIALCQDCADSLIEAHPRLYRPLPEYEPWPGAMPICWDCVHRDGISCTHRDAKVNGGPGIPLTFPEPFRAHVDIQKKGGGRQGMWRLMYRGPVTDCGGKDVDGAR
jgi:hypothetical protein